MAVQTLPAIPEKLITYIGYVCLTVIGAVIMKCLLTAVERLTLKLFGAPTSNGVKMEDFRMLTTEIKNHEQKLASLEDTISTCDENLTTITSSVLALEKRCNDRKESCGQIFQEIRNGIVRELKRIDTQNREEHAQLFTIGRGQGEQVASINQLQSTIMEQLDRIEKSLHR